MAKVEVQDNHFRRRAALASVLICLFPVNLNAAETDEPSEPAISAAASLRDTERRLERRANASERSSSGLTIFGEPANPRAASDALLRDLRKLGESQDALRNRLLEAQDQMARRLKTSVNLDLALRVPARPLEAESLQLLQVEARLNGTRILAESHPFRLEAEEVFPLFLGPVRPGRHELELKVWMGRLAHGWPLALAQGRTLVEERLTFELTSDAPRVRRTIRLQTPSGEAKSKLILEPSTAGAPLGRESRP